MLKIYHIYLFKNMIDRKREKEYGDTGIDQLGTKLELAFNILREFSIGI
jgi:hypothetical protein